MNDKKLIWRFITRKGGRNSFKWGVLFPLFGVIIGTLIVALTISIMEGLESKIFRSIYTFSSPAYLEVDKNEINEVELVLDEIEIENIKTVTRNTILHSGDGYRMVTILGVDSPSFFLKDFLDRDFKPEMFTANTIIIGANLSYKLGAFLGDDIYLISPLDLNIATSTPTKEKFEIVGIFEHDVKEYENNSAFIPYSNAINLFPNAHSFNLKLHNKLTEKQKRIVNSEVNNFIYKEWEADNSEFINAMKLEKVAYSIFGFLIVVISSFSLLTMMSMATIHKRKEIGILRTFGFTSSNISKIFYYQSITTALLGSLIGLFIANLFIFVNLKYDILVYLIAGFPFDEFPLILTYKSCILITVFTCLIMIVSSIYPASMIKKLQIVKAVENS